MSADRIARFMAFATIGTINVTQHLAASVLASIEGADADLVAEETLCLVATATSRTAGVGLKDDPEIADAASSAILDIPFSYRDYLIGGEMIEARDPSLSEAADQVYARLQRKREFYSAHLPPNQSPGERVLNEKMGLWMGRVSPPGLPEMPTARLEKLALVAPVLTHLKLVIAFGKKG